VTKTYDYTTSKGMLKSIKITTTTLVEVPTVEKGWMDSKFMEVLLSIDSEWKTARQLFKIIRDDTRLSISNSEMTTFLTMLREKGLVEYRKVSNKYREYRRMDKRNRDAQ
jgi:hypothetical protein